MTLYSPGTYSMVLKAIGTPNLKKAPASFLLPLKFVHAEGTDTSEYWAWLYFSSEASLKAFRLAANLGLVGKGFRVLCQVKQARDVKVPEEYNTWNPDWDFGAIDLKSVERVYG